MRFVEVTLAAPRERLAGLETFYGDLPLGETTLSFRGADGEPFYHFALLVPGDRFDAMLTWAEERFEILADAEGTRVFRTEDAWSSSAVYFHDPAGNILELIAHHGIEESGREGAFAAEEIVGLSELGVVGDRRALLERLEAVGLELYRGTVEEPDRLAFVGELGRTFILSPPGRGWLPLGRPAEYHPVEATIDAPGGLVGLRF